MDVIRGRNVLINVERFNIFLGSQQISCFFRLSTDFIQFFRVSTDFMLFFRLSTDLTFFKRLTTYKHRVI